MSRRLFLCVFRRSDAASVTHQKKGSQSGSDSTLLSDSTLGAELEKARGGGDGRGTSRHVASNRPSCLARVPIERSQKSRSIEAHLRCQSSPSSFPPSSPFPLKTSRSSPLPPLPSSQPSTPRSRRPGSQSTPLAWARIRRGLARGWVGWCWKEGAPPPRASWARQARSPSHR